MVSRIHGPTPDLGRNSLAAYRQTLWSSAPPKIARAPPATWDRQVPGGWRHAHRGSGWPSHRGGRDALKRALKDAVFIEALWLLIRTPQAAASKDFPANLNDLGMADMAPASLSDVLVSYDRAIEKVQRRLHAGATDLGEIARRASSSWFKW